APINPPGPSSWPSAASWTASPRSPPSAIITATPSPAGRWIRAGRYVMPMRSALTILFCLAAGAASADTPHLGKPVSAVDMKAWDIDIQADGTFLPPGSGTAAQGAPLFAEKCSACHGDGGRGTDLAKHGQPAPPILVSDKKFKPIDGGT